STTSITIINYVIMNQSSCMNKFNYSCSSKCSFIHLPFGYHFGNQKDEHGSHLLSLSVNDIIGNAVEQRHFRRHSIVELLFKKFHLLAYRFFNLFYYFHRRRKDNIILSGLKT